MFTPQKHAKLLGTSSMQSPITSNRGASSSFTANRSIRDSNVNTSIKESKPIIGKGSGHLLCTYGAPVPVKVSEAISNSRDTCSVNISPNGWACLVSHQIIVWQYEDQESGRAGVCRQLNFNAASPTELHSSRVCIVVRDSVSCYVVSSGGALRYWPNVLQENLYLDYRISLCGDQAVSRLLYVKGYRKVVAVTSDGTVLQIQANKTGVVCTPLVDQSSMLTSVSRRFSSFIFGGGDNSTAGSSRRLRGCCSTNSTADEEFVYVLTDENLTKLSYNNRGVVWQVNASQMVRQELSAQSLPSDSVWLLDVACSRTGLVLLTAFFNSDCAVQIAFLHVNTRGLIAPMHAERLVLTQYIIDAQQISDVDEHLLNHSLTYPDTLYQTAYIQTYDTIYITSTLDSQRNVSKIEVTESDSLLGVGYYDNAEHDSPPRDAAILIFTKRQNLMSLMSASAVDLQIGSMMREQSMEVDASQQLAEPLNNQRIAELSLSDSPTSKLKEAFLIWLQDGQPPGRHVIESMGIDVTGIERYICELSDKIVDDYSSSDPRWTERADSRDGDPSRVSSILHVNQLEGKLQVHRLLINFLTSTKLIDQVRRYRGRSVQQYLYEQTERIVACKSVCQAAETETRDVIQEVIRAVVGERGVETTEELTENDIFYTRVSEMLDFFPQLLQFESNEVNRLIQSNEIVSLISDVNSLLVNCILEVTRYRSAAFISNLFHQSKEILPWTQSKNTRDLLIKQVELTMQVALSHADSFSRSQALSHQAIELVDIVCDGFHAELSATPSDGLEDVYKQTRYELLHMFVEAGQFERGMEIAEKYSDFRILILICDKTNNEEKISEYAHRYTGKGFSEKLFDYYVAQGKRSKILSHNSVLISDLNDFLDEGHNSELRWLHDINVGDFTDAHKTLARLAVSERDSLSRKKTLFSLSKLAGLASDDCEELEEAFQAVDKQQKIIDYQENLSQELVQNLGMDVDNPPVMTPMQIVEALLSDSNTTATAVDYRRALDLINQCGDGISPTPGPDADARLATLRLDVWTAAILRDSWTPVADPASVCKDKNFFQLVDLLAQDLEPGADVMCLIPTLSEILSHEDLAALIKLNKNMEYILRAGYEILQENLVRDAS